MNHATRVLAFLLIGASCASCIAQCTEERGLLIYGFAPLRHRRLYVGPNKAFIGVPYNWAGVGRVTTSGPRINNFAVMISDTYFLTAKHDGIAAGEDVIFWLADDPANPTTYTPMTYAVSVASSQVTPGLDLAVGRFGTAPPSSIPRFPILNVPLAELARAGRGIYVMGAEPCNESETLLGLNNIEPTTRADYYDFTYDPSMGPDEAISRGGDSGGPSFVLLSNGNLALVGIHWSPGIDSYVPFHLAKLKTMIAPEQLTEVTEPSFLLGDMDMDHDVDFDDIDAFVLGLQYPSQYASTYGFPATRNGDTDGDGDLDFDDIEGFVIVLTGQPPLPIGPPSDLPGDMDFDKDNDTDDIAPFNLGLTDPTAYQSQYGWPSTFNGDLDNDGDQDFDDTGIFSTRILAPDPQTQPGDMDFDGDVDFDDIGDFVLAFASKRKYFLKHQHWGKVNGDIDQNGDLDFDDIAPFVALIEGL